MLGSYRSMTRAAQRIVDTFIDHLNGLVDENPEAANELLAGSSGEFTVLKLVNDLLAKTAEGATLLVARDTDGTLAGFVVKRVRAAQPVA